MAEVHLERFGIGVQNENGTPDVQAGSHPYSLTTTFVVKPGEGTLKDAQAELPPGFVGDPDATPRCTFPVLVKQENKEPSCANATAVGVATTFLYIAEEPQRSHAITEPVFNMVPPHGVAAEFGFVVGLKTPVLLQTSVRTGGDYGLTTTAPDVNQASLIAASKVTIWGVPANPAHNEIRGECENTEGGSGQILTEALGRGILEGEDERETPIHRKSEPGYSSELDPGLPAPSSEGAECPDPEPEIPLLTNPTSCGVSRTATFGVDSWEEPGNFVTGEHVSRLSASLPQLSGCEKLDFSPTLTVKPDLPNASTSTGLTVNVKVPQEATSNPVGLAEADVKDTTVMLPAGVAINPSGGNGLEACSSDPGALAGNQLGSPGDGIGYQGVAPSTQPGESVLGFSPSVPGSIAAKMAFSEGLLEEREDVLQPGVNFCSNASEIGTVRIKTPLLPNELTGHVYLAAQEANPFGSLLAMYMVAEDPVSGVLLKLPGETQLCKGRGEVIAGMTCEGVGQLVATFANTPQASAEEIELHFFGGELAPLATPAYCGTYTTHAAFTPWTAGEPANPGLIKRPSAEFQIEHGPGGGPCPGSTLPFSPSSTGGAENVNAGAFSPFTLTMSRADGEQNIQSVEAHLPPGLSGILTGVELCPEPQANLGECGPNSLIGETTVSVGVGGHPYTVTGGKFYLTGPYNGSGGCTVGQANCAPFGITFEVPAKAGPFDLAHTKSFSPPCDCILVRGKIEVNPLTAALTITSNPPGTPDAIPTSIEGIPLEIQHINATTTRGNFEFNPTNCSKMEVTGTIHSSDGGTDTIGVPFQVTNCQALKFEPKISFSTSGKNSKANGADLVTKVSYPNVPQGTDADLGYVKVELPKQLPSRLTTLQKACTDAQFESNPAACPAASKVGYAVVHTPLLPVPLTGPAIFVSHGGEAFPSLTMVLQGYGITIDLVGTTFISKAGITSTTFKTVPDQPFSSFELVLPQGPYSALTTNLPHESHDLCGQKLTMPSEFDGQNGAAIRQSTDITVTGCTPAITVLSHKVKGKTATIAVSVPAAGKLVATGKGLSKASKTANGATTLTLKLTLTNGEATALSKHKSRKLKAKINLTFTPKKGGQLKTTTTVSIG
jgi:hypothetical protein